MNKRRYGVALVSAIVLALLLLAVFVLGNRQEVLQRGNIADIEWYDENGTEFTITTAQELYDLATLSSFYDFEGQTFKLGADIVVNKGNAEDWGKKAPVNKWYPIKEFAGTFDGQGHTISGIYGKGIDTPMALFSDTKARSVIRDFRLVNSYFETFGGSGTASIASNVAGKFEKIYSDAILYCDGDYCAGMFSKILGETSIEESWFDGAVTLTGRNAGGIVDASVLGRVTIAHCLNSGSIVSEWDLGGAKAGGIIGTLEKSGADLILSDSLSVGKITVKNMYYAGSVLAVGYNGSTAKFSKTYASLDAYDQGIGRSGEQGIFTGDVLEIEEKSLTGDEGYRWTELDFKKYWTTVDNSTPILQCFADKVRDVSGLSKAFDTKWYDAGKKEFTIQTLEELYGFYMLSAEDDFKGKTVKLGADIVVNDGKAANWAKEAPKNSWYPIKSFAGTFDGQGHTVSGIYLSNSKQMNGFFSLTTSDSTVKNLNVKNSYFEHVSTGDAIIGSIAGCGNGTYENIYSNAIVTSSGAINGGLIGQVNLNAKTAIRNAWFDGELKLTTQTGRYGGGIVGTVVKGSTTVEHCLSTGVVSCEAVKTGLHVGGLIGAVMNEATKLQVSDCLYVGEMKTDYHVCVGAVLGRYSGGASVVIQDTYATSESYQHPEQGFMGVGTEAKGTLVGGVANYPKAQLTGFGGYEWTTLDFDNAWAVVKNGTPILKAFATNVPSVAGRIKKFDISWYKEDAKSYLIDSVKDLYGLYIISANTDFAGKTVKLGANIVVNEGNASDWAAKVPTYTWIPLKTFAGTFDGQGNSISGLYIAESMQRVGFFMETTKDSTVKNFKLENSYVTCTGEGTVMVGSIAGRGNGTFDTVYSNAIVTSGADGVGGLIGQINADAKNKITNCWFDGSVVMTGKGHYAGGIVANVVRGTTTIEHCLNTGTISAETKDTGMHIGGICAATMNEGTVLHIKDCLNAGKVDVNYHVCVGSVIGRVLTGTVVSITDTYATSESYVHPEHGFMGVGTESKGTLSGNVVNYDMVDLNGLSAYQRTTLDFGKYWAALTDKTPQLKSFAGAGLSVEGQAKLYDISWYDSNATTYVIDSVEDLFGFYLISATTDFAGKTVQLGANLTVNAGDATTWETNAPSKNWYAIKKFAGTFDGKGHTISGVYANSNTLYMGLFAETSAMATLKNFKLMNSYFSNSSTGFVYLGSIAGRGNGSFDNIYSDAIVTSAGSLVGGLIGQINNGGKNSITGCWYAGTLQQTSETATYGGGLVGAIAKGNTVIENCLNTGTVKSEAVNTGLHVGGLIGAVINKGTIVDIKHSLNSGVVDVDYHVCVGSIVGRTVLGTLNLEDTFATKESYKQTIGNNSTGTQNGNGIIVPKAYFTGTFGYQLSEFDFTNTWIALENKTPELKNFAVGTAVSIGGLDRADTSWYDASKDTYKIYDAADLYGVAKLSLSTDFKGKTIQVKKNVIDTKNALWMPIGVEQAFAGTFDGGLNTIQGINLNTDQSFIGLFGQVGGTVKNLRLEKSTITSRYSREYGYVGGVVGFLSGNLENVYSSVDVISGSSSCGGVVGRFGGNTSAKISGCWFDGTVTSSGQYVGGIVGEVHMGTKTISNCLSTGEVHSTWTTTNFPHVGGICGKVAQPEKGRVACLHLDNSLSVATIDAVGTSTVGAVVGRFAGDGELISTGTITNVYTTDESYNVAISTNTQGVIKDTDTKISASNFMRISETYLEGYFGYQMTEFDFEDTWVAIKDGTPELKKFAKGEVLSDLGGLHRADISWFQKNSGAEDDAYQIQNAAELYGLAKLTLNGNGFANKYIKLTAGFAVNEDMSNPRNEWIPIGNATKANFNGHFDGDMYTISGIYIKKKAQDIGLFGLTTKNSVIQNLKLENSHFESTVTGDANIGSIAGTGKGIFDTIKCESSVKVISSGANAGGLIGRITEVANHKIKNCWFAGSVESSAQASGGLVGRARLGTITMENCLYSGTLVNTLATNDANTNIAYAGGMVGWVYDEIGSNLTLDMRSCLNVGSVKVSADGGAGSVVGRARDKATFTHVYTTDDIEGIFNTTNGATGVGNYSKDVISGAPILKSTNDLKGKSGYETTQLDFYIKDVNENGVWVARNETYPALKSFVAEDKWNEVTGLANIRRVNTDWYYQNANTNANVYTISTAADLWGIVELTDVADSNHTNFNGKTIQMAKDITVFDGKASDWKAGNNLPSESWTPIGKTGYMFGGTFDGKGHTIRGVYVNTSGAYVGLFGRTNQNSVIKNLRLENSYFKSTISQGGEAYIGAIAGEGGGRFDTVYSNAIVESVGNYCGGIVGTVMNSDSQKNQFSECWFAGDVTGYTYVGGIVGLVSGSGTKVVMENCLSDGKVTGLLNHTAGICGAVGYGRSKNTLEMTNCLNVSEVLLGSIHCNSSVIGRILSTSEAKLTNVYTTNDAKLISGTDVVLKQVDGIGNNSGSATISGDKKANIVSEISIKGNAAISMGFDFANIWQTVTGETLDTPILQLKIK